MEREKKENKKHHNVYRGELGLIGASTKRKIRLNMKRIELAKKKSGSGVE